MSVAEIQLLEPVPSIIQDINRADLAMKTVTMIKDRRS